MRSRSFWWKYNQIIIFKNGASALIIYITMGNKFLIISIDEDI